jgi:hypothetical protein
MGQFLDGPEKKWKQDMEAFKATIRFLEKIGRLTYLPPAEYATTRMDHSHS